MAFFIFHHLVDQYKKDQIDTFYGTGYNPFAVVVMAHLKTQETRQDAQARRHWKFTLVRMLYEQGYSRENVLELFRFIDWVMVLPPALEYELGREIEEYEEAHRMQYISTIERMAHAEGIEQGIEQALRKATLDILEDRFTAVPESIEIALQQIKNAAL